VSASGRGGTRMVVLCEGETEKIAVEQFLRRQWDEDGLAHIALHPIDLQGKLEEIGDRAVRYLKDESVRAVFTLVDFQGMNRVEHGRGDSPAQGVERVAEWIRRRGGRECRGFLHAHVCVHQTEAWILAEGRALSRRLHDGSVKPDPNAEEKDFDKPPAARLNEMFKRARGDGYQKIRDGRPLFEAMSFHPVYESCPHFRAFYDDLKSAAQAASPEAGPEG